MSLLSHFNRTSRPAAAIAEIHALTRSIAAGDLSQRLREDVATDEARELLAAVNALLDTALGPVARLEVAMVHVLTEHDRATSTSCLRPIRSPATSAGSRIR